MNWCKDKCFFVISVAVISAAMALILLTAYWIFFPYKVLVVDHIRVLNVQAVPGSMLSWAVSYCKYADLPATVTLQFVDGVVFTAEPKIVANEVGCRQTIYTKELPNLPEGQYKLKLTYTYKVNPLRTVVVHAESNTFYLLDEE